jgi:5-methylthioadenosine/S-adenosylhomocysteine deaminase
VPKLIYSARGSDVTHTIVDGKVLMESGRVISLDEEKVLERSLAAREDLIERAGQETKDLLAMPWPKSGPAWRSLVK